MSQDIPCANPDCEEPWDAYGLSHGDMEPAEAKLFRQGKGCPSCNWGYDDSVPEEYAQALARERPLYSWPAKEGTADGRSPDTASSSEEVRGVALVAFLHGMDESHDTDDWLGDLDL